MSVTRFRKRSGTILGLCVLDDALLRRVTDPERLASRPRGRHHLEVRDRNEVADLELTPR